MANKDDQMQSICFIVPVPDEEIANIIIATAIDIGWCWWDGVDIDDVVLSTIASILGYESIPNCLYRWMVDTFSSIQSVLQSLDYEIYAVDIKSGMVFIVLEKEIRQDTF